ncbi:SPOR domain-containing protein [Pseudomonas sp. SWRI59]|uniref:SPOR domain-containing protein n=1 Tax=unclassified Pseudomonas TaxID=196821 RepID=UPI00164531B8|nr:MULTISPECIES: SPOR domain-containing protein [unclassified Pseudomonas]MBC3502625.1 SPOR domain-containing protein [Pseudomonas sp. SWRI59]MBC3507995.1 SPOR domain-containing protein [Pseudomonas sp. SWRI68]
MAVLDKGMKQRMVGALVLVALAVIFLPMLFTREDEMRQVRVEAPQAPAMPSLPEVKVEPVAVPEPQVIPEEPQQPPVVIDEATAPASTPSQPITPSPQTQAQAQAAKPSVLAQKVETKPAAAPAPAVAAAKPATPSKIDVNGLPVSWSIQLASLSNRAGAESLQQTLRSQGYNAYIRSAGGMNRVYVGPLIERAEAERVRDAINRKHSLKGFVMRFQPERG